MNIHLPAILMFTRGTRFWQTAKFGNSKCRRCAALNHLARLKLCPYGAEYFMRWSSQLKLTLNQRWFTLWQKSPKIAMENSPLSDGVSVGNEDFPKRLSIAPITCKGVATSTTSSRLAQTPIQGWMWSLLTEKLWERCTFWWIKIAEFHDVPCKIQRITGSPFWETDLVDHWEADTDASSQMSYDTVGDRLLRGGIADDGKMESSTPDSLNAFFLPFLMWTLNLHTGNLASWSE